MSARSLRILVSSLLSAGLLLGAGASAFAQESAEKAAPEDAASAGVETLKIDPVHSSVLFRVKHNNVAYVFGEIVDKSGTIQYDPQNPEKSSFSVEAKVDSIQTHNDKRNAHLKSADFFNAKQFPTITFESKSVKARGADTMEVSGDLTIHGKTNPVSVLVQMTGTGTNQQGQKLRGFYGTLNIKRTDYGMDFMVGPVSDNVKLILSFETVASGDAEAKK